MNPGDWTNAVKAAVISFVNAAVALAIALAVMLGWSPDVTQLAVVTGSIDTLVNAGAVLWILLTYRDSPARAQPHLLQERGLKP